WTHFPEGQSWMFGQVEVKPNIDYTLTSERSFIGCYVYGHGQYYAYMYPAGYITSQINT
ncbi:mucin-2, partial [Biomphalaria glabrata]